MRGIFGIASQTALDPGSSPDAVRDTLMHRGPDFAGTWYCADSGLAIAQQRSSIIDLTAAARQPLVEESDQLRVVFNGEIYSFCELRQ